MKKSVYFALAALTLVGCASKETAQMPEQEWEVPAARVTRTVTITAGFDETTKTSYDAEGKFSWVAGDKIGVLVSDGTETKQVTFTAQEGGAVTTFTGELEEGFNLMDYASYPFTGEMDGYACNDFAYDAEKGGWRIWGSIKPSLSDPLSCTPLFGTRKGDTQDYTFQTAVGVVKFTVQNVPMSTYYAYVEVPEGDANLNGWYDASQDGYLTMANAIEPWGNRYNWNVPTTLNSTLDYYFFFPVGTLPVGTKFELCDNNWTSIFSAEFKKEVAVVRNAVTNVAPIVLEPATTYTLADILGIYSMEVTAGPYSDNAAVGDLVIEESDNPEYDVMITMFAGVAGKQYGYFDGVNLLTFPCDQIFGVNPYDDFDTWPYVALDFYSGEVIDPQFVVLEQGKIQAVADAIGFRGCTEESWADSHGGSWPWELCYSSLTATWKEGGEEPEQGSGGEDLDQNIDVDPWS